MLKTMSIGKKVNLIWGVIEEYCINIISKLYRSYVRPHLEFWIPINVEDEDMLKGVQRRSTKMVPSFRNLSYDERLKRLGMYMRKD